MILILFGFGLDSVFVWIDHGDWCESAAISNNQEESCGWLTGPVKGWQRFYRTRKEVIEQSLSVWFNVDVRMQLNENK